MNSSEVHARQALRTDPSNARALTCLGVIAFKRDAYRDAQDYFHRAEDASRGEEGAVDLASLFAYTGQYERAKTKLTRVLAQRPDDLRAQVEYGQVLIALKQSNEGLAYLRAAVAAAPYHAFAQQALASALLTVGELGEAEKTARSALKWVSSRYAAGLELTLSRILTALGDKTERKEYHEDALKAALRSLKGNVASSGGQDTRDPEALLQVGIAYTRVKDYVEARRHFNQCRAIAPDHYLAERYSALLSTVTTGSILQDRRAARQYFFIVSGLAFVMSIVALVFRWHSKIGEPTTVALLTLSIGMGILAPLLPQLAKLELPGGMKAELQASKETLIPGIAASIPVNTVLDVNLGEIVPTMPISGLSGSL